MPGVVDRLNKMKMKKMDESHILDPHLYLHLGI